MTAAVRLVVTDLDGTLLDEDTYDVAPARPALLALRERHVPVVLCSSKTRGEMEPLAAALLLSAPFIAENGGAIVFPPGVAAPPGTASLVDGAVLPLGTARRDLVAALPDVAGEAGAVVRSFSAMTVAEVAALTGLAEADARLARLREWDEPFVAEATPDPESLDERLAAAARRRGLRVTRGGRFHHLTGPTDKGAAVRALLGLLPAALPGATVGLGDAANDLSMLQAVERPVVMPRKRGGFDPILAAALPDALRAPAPGPTGWAAAVLGLLAGTPVLPRSESMKKDVPLEPRVAERLGELGTVELLVGIPSYNNADTIAHVVRAASIGLAKYFPGKKAVIVNSDGGSKDGTPDVVAQTDLGSPGAILVSHPLSPVHKILTPYHGLPGKGSAFRTVFAIAERLQAKACAVVDSDLRSITPEWIELLLAPIVTRDFDYVAPLYLRHKFDGTITNSIVYPLTRALYGREVRQPIGGEFGFSGRVASHYLGKPVWESDVARFGIDIWMTTTAIADGFRVCQSFLGAKIHDPKDPGSDLAGMLVQVVSSVFDLMVTYEERWKAVEGAEDVPLFGFPHGVGLEPVNVNVGRMVGIFRQGVRDLAEVWAHVLEEGTLGEVRALAAEGDEETFRFPDPLWVRVVYDYALGYRRRALTREQLLRSLVPLYLGRTASFVLQNRNSGADEVEAAIRALADEFVGQKNYLRERWP